MFTDENTEGYSPRQLEIANEVLEKLPATGLFTMPNGKFDIKNASDAILAAMPEYAPTADSLLNAVVYAARAPLRAAAEVRLKADLVAAEAKYAAVVKSCEGCLRTPDVQQALNQAGGLLSDEKHWAAREGKKAEFTSLWHPDGAHAHGVDLPTE